MQDDELVNLQALDRQRVAGAKVVQFLELDPWQRAVPVDGDEQFAALDEKQVSLLVPVGGTVAASNGDELVERYMGPVLPMNAANLKRSTDGRLVPRNPPSPAPALLNPAVRERRHTVLSCRCRAYGCGSARPGSERRSRLPASAQGRGQPQSCTVPAHGSV